MELPEKGWLLRIVNSLEVGESTTIKNNGIGVLRITSNLNNDNEYKCKLYCDKECYIEGVIASNSFKASRSISSVDKRFISIEEMVITRKGESDAECWIKKAIQNGSSIYAIPQNAVSINEILRYEARKKKWPIDCKAKFSEITFRDTIIPPEQLKTLLGEDYKSIEAQSSSTTTEHEEEEEDKNDTNKKEEEEDDDDDDEGKESKGKNENNDKVEKRKDREKRFDKMNHVPSPPHKKPKVVERVKVNKLTWIDLSGVSPQISSLDFL